MEQKVSLCSITLLQQPTIEAACPHPRIRPMGVCQAHWTLVVMVTIITAQFKVVETSSIEEPTPTMVGSTREPRSGPDRLLLMQTLWLHMPRHLTSSFAPAVITAAGGGGPTMKRDSLRCFVLSRGSIGETYWVIPHFEVDTPGHPVEDPWRTPAGPWISNLLSVLSLPTVVCVKNNTASELHDSFIKNKT